MSATSGASRTSLPSGCALAFEVERYQREIAAIEATLLAGHPDVAGLCLALSDWSAELRILKNEKKAAWREPSG